MSEPGGGVDHDFARYLGRFAHLDQPPRHAETKEEVRGYPDPEPHLPDEEEQPPLEYRSSTKNSMIQAAHLAHMHGPPPVLAEPRSRSRSPPMRRADPAAERRRPAAATAAPSNDHKVTRASEPLPRQPDAPVSREPEARPSEPHIVQYLDRVEIETPGPARVRELRSKLWDPNESLQVSKKPVSQAPERLASLKYDRQGLNRRWNEYYEHQLSEEAHAKQEQDLLAEQRARRRDQEHLQQQQQRESRSLSPAASRSRSAVNTSASTAGSSTAALASSTSSMLFKSRFYEAAQRGMVSSSSPDRSSASDRRSGVSSRANKSGDSLYQSAVGSGDEETPHRAASQVSLATNRSTRTDVSVATLLAKLTAVKRDNPDEALREIDAILKAESASSGEPLVVANPVLDDESLEGSEDDETSVSSITNPTFGVKPTEQTKEVATSAKSAGQPRPSSLQNYSSKVAQTTKLAEAKAKSKSRSRRERSPPPASINVSSTKDKKETLVANPEKVLTGYQRLEHGADERPPIPVQTDPLAKPGPETKPAVRSTVRNTLDWKMNSNLNPADGCPVPDPEIAEAVDRFLTPVPDEAQTIGPANSLELAEKIRRWDEMSGPEFINRVCPCDPNEADDKSSGLLSASQHRLTPGNRRPHPWDGAVPVTMGRIDVRDTSMESACGVETEFSPKYDEFASPASSARQLRMERIRKSASSDSASDRGGSVPSTGRQAVNEAQSPVASNADFTGDRFEVDPKLLADSESWEERPRWSVRQEQSKTLSDDFDSAWVALPSSNFFQSQKSGDAAPTGRSVAESKTESGANVAKGELQDAPDPEPMVTQQLQKFSPTTESPSRSTHNYKPPEVAKSGELRLDYKDRRYEREEAMASNQQQAQLADYDDQLEVGLVSSGNGTETKHRRGLRAFLKRRQNGKSSASHASASVSSASRKISSARTLDHDLMDHTPVASGRRSRDSRSPSRDRARSLEERRIRNPTIAKKFSRLLRVYDEKGETNQVGNI